MARYIEADKFIERLEVSPAFPNMGMDGFFLRDVVINMLGNMPTTDVVPKSAVDALEREIERLKKSILPSYCQAVNEEEAIKIGKAYGRAEAAGEIFEEIDELFRKYFNRSSQKPEFDILEPILQAERFIINEMQHDVTELKKKYTENENG